MRKYKIKQKDKPPVQAIGMLKPNNIIYQTSNTRIQEARRRQLRSGSGPSK